MLFSALYATMRMSSRGLVVMRPWDGSSCWWRVDRRRAHCRAPHERHKKGDLRHIIVCEPDEVKGARRHDVKHGAKEYVEARAVTMANNTTNPAVKRRPQDPHKFNAGKWDKIEYVFVVSRWVTRSDPHGTVEK